MVISGGGGGAAKAGNLSFDFDWMPAYQQTSYLVGFGIDVVFNQDNGRNIYDYPLPYDTYTYVGDRHFNPESGVYLKLGVEPVYNSGVYFFALGGANAVQMTPVVRSNTTGWLYSMGSSETYYGLFGGGVEYLPRYNRVSFQAAYDNRRGVTAGLGYRW